MKKNKSKNIFVEGPISPVSIAESIQKHSDKTNIGGHSIFLGQVRADQIAEHQVTGIVYTAYEEMASQKMDDIREEIFKKFDLTCMHVYHSLGLVAVGEICLFVFTSSAHRKECMQACDELVERIKSELPIWGKEILSDESYQWKENK